MARKGRARRFREARELKQGFDDGLFEEKPSTSLADVEEGQEGWKTLDDDDDDKDHDHKIVTDTTDEDYDPLND